MSKQYLDLTGLKKYDELIKKYSDDKLSIEITNRGTAEDALQKAIEDEASARKAADSDLGQKIAAKGTGSVTSVATGDGLTGGPITTTGTINHATPSGASTTSSGFYKVATDKFGHVTGTTAVTKADITGLGIPGSDTNTAHTHEAGTGLQLDTGTEYGTGGTSGKVKYSLKTATSSTIGGVKSSTTGTTSGRDYNVQVNTDGTMKVNVPWTDTNTNTTYTLANGEGTDASKLQLKDQSGNIASSIVVNYAEIAEKATNDGDGNKISATYLKLNGGTITGKVTFKGKNAALVVGEDYNGSGQALSVVNGLSVDNLYVTGTETVNQVKDLDVTDQIISTNSEGATLTGLSGLLIVTGEPSVGDTSTEFLFPAYGIVRDLTDTVKLGLGTKKVTYDDQGNRTSEFTFNEGEGEPVAIRADSDSITDDHLLMWDSDTFKIVDSGHTYSDITTAINNVNSKLGNYVTVAGAQNVTGIKTFTSGLKCSVAPTANDEVLRYQDIDSITTSSIEALF